MIRDQVNEPNNISVVTERERLAEIDFNAHTCVGHS